MTENDKSEKRLAQSRGVIEKSNECGCFYCLKIFDPSKIEEWVGGNSKVGEVAICPFCSIDAIIGVVGGRLITKAFLEELYEESFNTCYHPASGKWFKLKYDPKTKEWNKKEIEKPE